MSRGRGRRFLIDGSMARGGGGFTYLVNILPQLCAMAPDDRFRVLLRSERLAKSIAPAANLEIDLLPDANWVQRLRFTYRDLPRLAADWNTDLYFSAGETAPPSAPCPTIASFRNPIIYTDLDLGFAWKHKLRVRALREISRLSSHTCDRIMFVSQDSANWIGDSLGIPERRRAVIHHGIDLDAWARPAPESTTAAQSSYILSVSSVYRHKNYVRLIEAYASLARRRADVPDLVIVGDVQCPEYAAEMERARANAGEGIAEGIHILGEVPYAEIKTYYAGADLFVFPSYLETFGHPMLEAMASATPTVAADIPCFREIAGDAAFYFDPHKTEALTAAIEEALFVPRARQSLVKRGLQRVQEFGWNATARRLLALFDEVMLERAATA